MTNKYLLLLGMLMGCHPSAPPSFVLAEAVSGPLPTDSAVLARLAAVHPCRVDLPRVRYSADSLPGAAPCTLISAAFAAIEHHRGDPEVFADLGSFSVKDVRCALVRAEAYRDERTGAIDDAHWIVELLTDRQPSLAVEINRRNGDARPYRILPEFGITAADICEGRTH